MIIIDNELSIRYYSNNELICTEKDIKERIERDNVWYFYHDALRDVYKNKILKELKR